MLRASGQHDSNDYFLAGVTERAGATGVANGDVLLRFVDAALGRDVALLEAARSVTVGLIGLAGMSDAAAVIGGFDGITRIADATGIPVEPAKAEGAADFIAALGIGRFRAEKI